MIPATMPTPADAQARRAADPTTEQARRLATVTAGRRRALASLARYRTVDNGVGAAQNARDAVACDVARACVARRFPDPDDVEAYRLLSDLSRRAERYLFARVAERIAS